MSKLIERQNRIQRRIKSSSTEIDYTNYIQQLNLQRTNYSTTPKLYPAFDLNSSFKPDLLSLNSLTKLLDNNYFYTGVVYYGKSLYLEDVSIKNTLYYYEFVSIQNNINSSFDQWSYIYIPINLVDQINDKLPALKTWNNKRLGLSYPSQSHLITVKESTSYSSNLPEVEHITKDNTHPFLPNFYFNGYSFQHGDGGITYEYFDSKGYYGIQDAVYLSNLRPSLVKYPLGQVFEGDLVENSTFKLLIGQYPEYGEEPWYGPFLGYTTTSQYSSKSVFYLYKQHSTEETFLSPAPPSVQAKSILAPYLTK